MNMIHLLVAALLFAPPLRAPEVEALAQELRSYDEQFVKRPPLELTIPDAIETFHRLWHLGLKGVKAAGKDAELAKDFREIAEKSRVATYAAMSAEPFFRVALRTDLPRVSPEHERRTGRMVATVVARGEEVQRAISRILTRFPLWTDDAVWGPRPLPPDEPPPRFTR